LSDPEFLQTFLKTANCVCFGFTLPNRSLCAFDYTACNLTLFYYQITFYYESCEFQFTQVCLHVKNYQIKKRK